MRDKVGWVGNHGNVKPTTFIYKKTIFRQISQQ